MADPFCSEVARQEGAPLGGTATHAAAWLLVEHRGPWGAQAVEENDLPEPVQAWLRAQVTSVGALVGKVRPLLLRREGEPSRPLACFLAVAREDRQDLFRVDVERHEELLAHDLAAMLTSGELERWRSSQRLTLVCGNGRRDRCCARWGLATWRSLAPLIGDDAWLSTHQGGHRYAGTGLWLPEGAAYGFLAAGEAAALVAARQQGNLHLRCFRGRTFHPVQVQAADAQLREATGVSGLGAWRLAEATEEEAGAWRIVFAGEGVRYTVRLLHGSEAALVSCGPAKVKTIDRFTLASWQREESP